MDTPPGNLGATESDLVTRTFRSSTAIGATCTIRHAASVVISSTRADEVLQLLAADEPDPQDIDWRWRRP